MEHCAVHKLITHPLPLLTILTLVIRVTFNHYLSILDHLLLIWESVFDSTVITPIGCHNHIPHRTVFGKPNELVCQMKMK